MKKETPKLNTDREVLLALCEVADGHDKQIQGLHKQIETLERVLEIFGDVLRSVVKKGAPQVEGSGKR